MCHTFDYIYSLAYTFTSYKQVSLNGKRTHFLSNHLLSRMRMSRPLMSHDLNHTGSVLLDLEQHEFKARLKSSNMFGTKYRWTGSKTGLTDLNNNQIGNKHLCVSNRKTNYINQILSLKHIKYVNRKGYCVGCCWSPAHTAFHLSVNTHLFILYIYFKSLLCLADAGVKLVKKRRNDLCCVHINTQ